METNLCHRSYKHKHSFYLLTQHNIPLLHHLLLHTSSHNVPNTFECTIESQANNIGECTVKNTNTDNQSVLQAYFNSSDNATKILLNPSTYDNELNLSTGGIATGEADMSTSGNSYYGDNTSYIRYSRSEIDGGSITFTKYGIIGERLEGNFATTLCNYDFNMKTYVGTHSIDCEDKSIWIRGAFSILRSADQ